MHRSPIVVVGFCLIVGLAGAGVSGAPLYLADSASHLLRVDVTTGQVEEVFRSGVQFTDIAFAPTGELYGVTRDYLYQIDPATGWSTLIGPHRFGGVNNPYGIDSLACGSDGVLYAAGNNILISIDTLTGTGKAIGSLSGHRSAGDLTLDGKGRLLLTTDVGGLVEINTERGGARLLGRLPYSDVYAMGTDTDGTLYGVRSTNEILRIDPDPCTVVAAGALHATALIGYAWGAAFPIAHLPEPATLLLLVLCTPMMGRARRNDST